MFRLEHVSFQYHTVSNQIPALKDVSLHIAPGQWWGIVGANGSGKSTLARLLNGLLTPEHGQVYACGLPVAEEANCLTIRRQVGFVFQNPDNQMVGNTIEEEVAFGPENAGLPRDEIRRCITESLAIVGLSGMEERDPTKLSGGQKQRLAIAGALAMKPKALILDEATAMLDGEGRGEIVALLKKLHSEGMTIVSISHDMEEVLQTEYLAVMEKGSLVAQGTPREIFAAMREELQWGIQVPEISRVAAQLVARGMSPDLMAALTVEEMIEKLCR